MALITKWGYLLIIIYKKKSSPQVRDVILQGLQSSCASDVIKRAYIAGAISDFVFLLVKHFS